MARLFFFPKVDTYNIYEGLAIAAFAFADLIWAIRSLVKERKKNNLVMIGLKCGSLSNGLSAIVLAQIAILAFTNPGVDYSFDNAIGGMVFGGADLLIGLLMVFIYFQKRKSPTVGTSSLTSRSIILVGQIAQEAFGGGARLRTVLHRNADFAVKRRIQRLRHKAKWRALEDQGREHADAEPLLHHRHDRVIVPAPEADIERCTLP
jgi:hypothetical protein